jgi:protein-S-isoprenylcysteine O-methyltransferase Ste14
MKKLFSLFYGVIAYLVFLVAFFYAIGFVGNFIVPKSIDSGAAPLTLQAIIINVLLLSLFALQHTVMARPAFKSWWTRIIGTTIERSTYVLLASLILLLMYWQWQPIAGVVWNVESAGLSNLITGVYFFGWLIVFLSTLMISHFELFGLTQVINNLRDEYAQPATFREKFFYRIVRHPIMLGFIISFWATPVMTVGHILFSVMTTGYILVAVKFFEERDLRKLYGDEYEAYSQRVPMIIPFTKRKTEIETESNEQWA